jgi:broad specificity phosphatase PhoE
MTLLLVRHAEPSNADSGRLGGDPPLSEWGSLQAARLAEEPSFAKAAALYSSPARRALDTAAPICDALGIEPRIMPGLREIDFGRADGLTYKQVETEFPDFYYRLMNETDATRFPDGEGRSDLRVRVRATLDEIVSAHTDDAAKSSAVVIVTHAGVVRTAADLVGLEDPNPDFGSVTELSWRMKSPPS